MDTFLALIFNVFISKGLVILSDESSWNLTEILKMPRHNRQSLKVHCYFYYISEHLTRRKMNKAEVSLAIFFQLAWHFKKMHSPMKHVGIFKVNFHRIGFKKHIWPQVACFSGVGAQEKRNLLYKIKRIDKQSVSHQCKEMSGFLHPPSLALWLPGLACAGIFQQLFPVLSIPAHWKTQF